MFRDGCVKTICDLELKILEDFFWNSKRFCRASIDLLNCLNQTKDEKNMGFENSGGFSGFLKTFCHLDN